MGELDIAIKVLLQLEPEALARLLLPGLPALRSIHAGEAELPIAKLFHDKFVAEGQANVLEPMLRARIGDAAPGYVARMGKASKDVVQEVTLLLLLRPLDEAGYRAELDRLLPPV